MSVAAWDAKGEISEIFVGHDDKLELIKASVTGENPSHSFLLHGPKNMGKSLFALLMAASHNCLQKNNGLACLKCDNCKRIARSKFSYLSLLSYKFGEIPIDDIRTRIIAPSILKVPNGSKQFFIINDARFFNSESANCFLKTLEEPTANKIFILITSSPDSILPTIRSRCQLVRFEAVEERIVKKHLNAISPDTGEDVLSFIARASVSIGSAVAAVTSVGFERGVSMSVSVLKSIVAGNLKAADAAGLIGWIYDAGLCDELEEMAGEENILQLDELFDKIERVSVAKQYARLSLAYSMLYSAKKNSRRDYFTLVHELAFKIDAYFLAIEKFFEQYLAGFKQSFNAAAVKDMSERAKKEITRLKRDEYLKTMTNILESLQRFYVLKAVAGCDSEKGETSVFEASGAALAKLYPAHEVESAVKVMLDGYYRDVAANINVDLYLERYLMTLIEK